MFKLKTYCNDGDMGKYWEDGVDVFKTHDEALLSCFRTALEEARGLMETSGESDNWFEVETDFEVTGEYHTGGFVETGTVFPVAVVFYDHAPWDRENDCDIQIVTGYAIVEVEE